MAYPARRLGYVQGSCPLRRFCPHLTRSPQKTTRDLAEQAVQVLELLDVFVMQKTFPLALSLLVYKFLTCGCPLHNGRKWHDSHDLHLPCRCGVPDIMAKFFLCRSGPLSLPGSLFTPRRQPRYQHRLLLLQPQLSQRRRWMVKMSRRVALALPVPDEVSCDGPFPQNFHRRPQINCSRQTTWRVGSMSAAHEGNGKQFNTATSVGFLRRTL